METRFYFQKNILLSPLIQFFRRTIFFIFLVLCFPINNLFAQKITIICHEIHQDSLQELSPHSLCFPSKATHSQIPKLLSKAIIKNQADGYLNFSIDTSFFIADTFYIQIFRGIRYPAISFQFTDSAKKHITHTPLTQYIENDHISWKEYPLFNHQFVTYYENKGYPFASTQLLDIQQQDQQLYGLINATIGPYICYDTICIKGDALISKRFLQSYLQFREGKPYQEHKVKQIPKLLEELPFISLTRPSGIEFSKDAATLYIFANRKKINQFDGYIGLVPIDEHSGKVTLSGELNLHLRNLFKTGECIDLEWNASEKFSQDLYIHTEFPYILKTPLGLNGTFSLEKKDTSYVNNRYKIGILYHMSANNKLQFYYSYENSNLIHTTGLTNSATNNYKKNFYGISFNYRNLDYIYNPRKGINCTADINLIRKKTEDGILSTQSTLLFQIDGYIPLHTRWILVLGGKHGSLLGKNLLINELFRIGGLKTIQGFNDKSLATNSYSISNIEIRFLYMRNAYLHLFCNGGYIERKTQNEYTYDLPIGFGIGTTLETRAGQFYISYALGKLRNTSITLRTGKIHFGMLFNF